MVKHNDAELLCRNYCGNSLLVRYEPKQCYQSKHEYPAGLYPSDGTLQLVTEVNKVHRATVINTVESLWNSSRLD